MASRTVSMSDAPVALLRSSRRACVSVSTLIVVVRIPSVYIMYAIRSTPKPITNSVVITIAVTVADAAIVANAVGDEGPDGAAARVVLRVERDLAAPDLVDVETVSVLRRRWLNCELVTADARLANAPGRRCQICLRSILTSPINHSRSIGLSARRVGH